MEQQHIDELLEQYLGLLNEYTVLRQTLSQLQSGVYHNIARANFSGERGMRYGQDHYDERMKAARRLAIDVDDTLKPNFAVVDAHAEKPEEEKAETSGEPEKQEGKDDVQNPAKQNKNKNPLHWFGLFAPMPLRAAQTQSVQVVEEVIPRLVSINAEMLDLEIEVRRARKRRAKAEAAAEKNGGTASVTDAQPQTAPVKASQSS
ncbi:hypothetical protein B0J13DRAFT_119709 [Dactylonectria estremocensis]|uniref:Vacuolar ATPase assembly protein VMA22 n=1 Tax=Dactylonectria estremocensis TaxID=1079267 RepID=A0A9P9JID4_9HYPO|nr:hypothetical protein B0J13DRAFT_119709 [Dactylonectria estremocensis]